MVECLIITAAIKEVKGRVQGAEGPRNCCHNYSGNNICQSCHSGANRNPAPFCHSVHAKHDTESSVIRQVPIFPLLDTGASNVIFLDTGFLRYDEKKELDCGVRRNSGTN